MPEQVENGSRYDDRNRAFLQAFIARSTLTYEDARPLIAAIENAYEGQSISAEEVTTSHFRRYVNQANKAISGFDFEIRNARHQETQERVYAFINSSNDPLAQLATIFSVDEIAFLKRVLDAMFETNNTTRHEIMAVTGTEALHLSKPSHGGGRRSTAPRVDAEGRTLAVDQGITGAQAQRMLNSLVSQGWFEHSRKGYYTLSPRALLELRGWLMGTYNDQADEDGNGGVDRIRLCHACKEIVTMGQRCTRLSCACRIHDTCIENFFTMQRSRDCPICGTEWTSQEFVGERAAYSRASGGGTSGSRGRPSTVAQDEADSSSDS